MTRKEHLQLKRWVETWKKAGPELQRIRLREVRRVNTADSIMALSDAFDSALLHFPPKKTSGLVEQQAWFMKARR